MKGVIGLLKVILNLLFFSFDLTNVVLQKNSDIFCYCDQWRIEILFVFWRFFLCLFTCLENVLEHLFWSLKSLRFCQITGNGHHFTNLINFLLLLLWIFNNCSIFMRFVVGITFIQIRLSFFHLFKIIRILKHYFFLFKERSSSDNLFE